jgi:hypothetical protein
MHFKGTDMSKLTKEQIREIFLAHGFTIKDGQTDLKPYVFEAADALIAAALASHGAEPATQGVPEDLRKAINAVVSWLDWSGGLPTMAGQSMTRDLQRLRAALAATPDGEVQNG